MSMRARHGCYRGATDSKSSSCRVNLSASSRGPPGCCVRIPASRMKSHHHPESVAKYVAQQAAVDHSKTRQTVARQLSPSTLYGCDDRTLQQWQDEGVSGCDCGGRRALSSLRTLGALPSLTQEPRAVEVG